MILINGPSRCQNRRPGAGCRDAGIRSGRPLAWRGDLRSPRRHVSTAQSRRTTRLLPVRGALPPEGRPQVAPTWDVGRAKGGVGTPGRRLRDGRVCLVVAGVLVSHDATTEKIPAISWSGRSCCSELPAGEFSDAEETYLKCLGTGTYGVHGSIYGPDYELRPRDFRHLGGSARSTAQLWPAVLFGEQGMTLFTRLPPLNVYKRSSSCKDF
jgi:hypothetical protein